MQLLLAALLFFGVAVLAYANGSNDISKGIATLVGSGVTNYRSAILWGTLWTVAGSFAAALFSTSMIRTFSTGFVPSQFEIHPAFVLAVLTGAIGWILFSTKTGLPVSTTHAITGALCGTAVAAFGLHGIAWMVVTKKIFVPLLVSPLIALAALWILFPALRFVLAPLSRRCACAQISQPLATAVPPGVAAATVRRTGLVAPPSVVVNHLENCEGRSNIIAGIALDDGLHWLSSGLTSFARALNDAPKIVALGVAVTLIGQRDSSSLILLVAVAMGLGSWIAGLRVTETLAEKVAPMNAVEGLSANLITSFLVAWASRWGLPVSTTHVSSGAIIGIGLRRSKESVQWKTVKAMIQAWMITLPVAALIAVLCLEFLRRIIGIS